MTWTSLRRFSAGYIGALCGIYLGGWLQAQPQIESSLGKGDPPPIVGMTQTCPGFLIATGELQAENDRRYWSIGYANLMLHPDGIPAQQVRYLLGKKVDLVIREVEPLRVRQTLDR